MIRHHTSQNRTALNPLTFPKPAGMLEEDEMFFDFILNLLNLSQMDINRTHIHQTESRCFN
ncbi:unnamed protein product [Clavelina lepadiformis]|uniref:Uncharacterized protein n=1 Tax=Clavelina lepadiformis TaxID=159417 RepID=A0ABP0FIF3_CLALP